MIKGKNAWPIMARGWKNGKRNAECDWKNLKDQLLEDSEVKKEYESLEPEFEFIKEITKFRIENNLTQKELAELIVTKQSATAEQVLEMCLDSFDTMVADNRLEAMKNGYEIVLDAEEAWEDLDII